MSLDFSEIRQLMAELEQSSLRELRIDDGDFHLHLSKNEQLAAMSTGLTSEPTVDPVSDEVKVNPMDKPAKPTSAIKAPLVGTVYLKAKPDAAAFKQVGDHVAVGEQVAIIEAMKLMTPVKSEVSGVITEILVEEEEVVDFDKPLFLVTEEG
ncbi:acetyl-CoA carboxylase, biotin carboxyl carrier protein [Weissella diestrammenae]|uniref:Biotin carboxyl carrier protein of acetyl-CoA carboxylase n=1 Tax=Weissella diestrammenae TaxID=1162633 RepID=A0A7G9T620_9LACO|nr:biotin/lipoyl-containing protein [Weissella diestrammenae]MCM0582380.1 acetyl-CoA carboxylase, biotin carboxyl carrier protein [Weissella diestrammenae]QNN75545.1 acetyl-CoA carboxylase, biotin carboxyl carrier protein [Weissella diestrammenae]